METMIIQVFSDMDFLGWYSTGDSPGVQEITVHQQISDINESPLFLQVNRSFKLKLVFTLFIQMAPGAASTDLPVSLYESVIDMVNLQVSEWKFDKPVFLKQTTNMNWTEQARMLFVKLPYTLATEEAERIGLDHVARFVFNFVQI